MVKTVIKIVILSSLLFSVSVSSGEPEEYLSPDGVFRAYIVTTQRLPDTPGESEVVIKAENGELLFSENYNSEDGDQGLFVEKASWTPDSKFFVYSMSSSGGHQPWRFPTFVVSTATFKVIRLDGDAISSVTDPGFTLLTPDIFKASGLETETMDETEFELSLSEIFQKMESDRVSASLAEETEATGSDSTNR
jgi:hypothetical protein